jgi:MOSC domain-containing protein YiiM
MEPRERLDVVSGHGIVGDRYANGRGHWSYEPRYVSEITFIEREALERVGAALGFAFEPAESRRNVVTSGVHLQELIGQRFGVGDAVFWGERPCDPCRYLERLVHKPVKALLGVDGGLRARIVVGGTIAVGDRITRLHA